MEHQYKPTGEHTHLTFGVHFDQMIMCCTYYVCDMMLLWPKFVTGGTAGLNFFACCVLPIDEVDTLIEKISENRDKLKLLKHM